MTQTWPSSVPPPKSLLETGETASFWHDNWSPKGPIRLFAPDLFEIATSKNRSVSKELSNGNWIRSIARLSTPAQLSQYLLVCDVVESTQLVPGQADVVAWTLTADGTYSASSAYHAQFHGSHPKFTSKKI
uniref:Uncharacterized protein n=1 Tax=Avena sativa TaxID=4498 RepID=A0ACD5U9A0_AVESA